LFREEREGSMSAFRVRRRSVAGNVLCAFLLLVSVFGVAAAGHTDDGVDLTVERSSTPGEAVLSWTGSLPAYGVYRSQDPESVIGPLTQVALTEATSWADTPSAAPVHYYNVSQTSCGNPANTSCLTALNLGIVTDSDFTGNIEVQRLSELSVPGQSRWYRLLAEDLPFDDWKLLVKVFNISAGHDVDLFAYRRNDGNTCTSSPLVTPSVPGSCNLDISGCGGNQENSNRCSSNSGTADECVSWFEGCTGFLEDDQTVVWIEVRHVSGGCGTFDIKFRNNGNNDNLTCSTY
jgi:hypothetical protein